jgi:hypothetical protein
MDGMYQKLRRFFGLGFEADGVARGEPSRDDSAFIVVEDVEDDGVELRCEGDTILVVEGKEGLWRRRLSLAS